VSRIPLRELSSVGSTNDVAWRDGPAAVGEGLRAFAVRADEQTEGRGRQGRAWSSPRGSGLYLSVYLALDWPPERARYLTLAAGLALREALSDLSGFTPDVKWPNDLIAGTDPPRKLAGVLTETRVEGARVSAAVIGLGCNLRTPAGGFDVPAPPGDGGLAALAPVALDALVPASRLPAATALAQATADALAASVERLAAGTVAVDELLARFRAACPMWGRPVRFVSGGVVQEGEAHGVAPDGGLVVRLAGGATTVLHAGDVHLVPVST